MTGPVATVALTFVGCGAFARRYHLPAVEEDSAIEVRAVCDPYPSPEVEAFAARHGARLVDRIDRLEPASEHGAAIVSSPHTLHADHARDLLERGYHVLVDKPFVMRVADARDLAETATERGLVNGVAFNRRFDRSCLRARSIIESGGIGPLRFVQTVQLGYERAGWFLEPALGGGGPYTGRGAHMGDIVPWLTGRTPSRLRSRVRGGDAQRTDAGGFIEMQLGDVECQMTCIEEGWHMWDEIRLFGEAGLIELRRPLDLPIGWTLECQTERGAASERLRADPRPGAATRNFLGAVRGQEAIECSFESATTSVAIVEAAFRSATNGGTWETLG